MQVSSNTFGLGLRPDPAVSRGSVCRGHDRGGVRLGSRQRRDHLVAELRPRPGTAVARARRDRARLRRASRRGKPILALRGHHWRRAAAMPAAAWCSRRSTASSSTSARNPRPSGSRTPGAGSPDAGDRPARVHGIIRVITERFEAERQQSVSAQRDVATGVFNRSFFVEHLSRQLSLAARKNSTFAVLLIGFDLAGLVGAGRGGRGRRGGGMYGSREAPDALARGGRPLRRGQVRRPARGLATRRRRRQRRRGS